MILAVPLTFFGCQDILEMDDSGLVAGGTPLEQAIAWYNLQKNGEPVLLKPQSKADGGQLFYTEPSWEYTCTSSNEELVVVDVDLTDRIGLDFVPLTNLSKFKKSGEYKYRRSYSRLVVMTDKGSLRKSGYVMTILPSVWYIENHEADIHLNTYLHREPHLDGYVLFHDLNGQFVNGWRYESGKVTGHIKNLSDGHQDEESDAVFNYETMPASYTVARATQSRYGSEGYWGGSGGSGGGGGNISGSGSGNNGGNDGITGNNTDGYVIPEVVVVGTGGSGNTVILPPEIVFPTDSGNKGSGVIEAGGGSGNVSGGVTDDNHPKQDKITLENFLKKIFTPEFIEKVFRELGVNTGKIKITFELVANPTTNASYNQETKTLNINPPMLERRYTEADLTSIIYHEMVHAKQDMVDHIQIERDSKGYIVMKEYQVPYDDHDIAECWDAFYNLLDIKKIPRELEKCNSKEKIRWNSYYETIVKPTEEDVKNGETHIIKANLKYYKCEIEAYKVQLKRYGNQMSESFRKLMEKNLEDYRRKYKYINNEK